MRGRDAHHARVKGARGRMRHSREHEDAGTPANIAEPSAKSSGTQGGARGRRRRGGDNLAGPGDVRSVLIVADNVANPPDAALHLRVCPGVERSVIHALASTVE